MDHDPAPDYRAILEAAPDLYLVLDPQLVVVAVSDAYLHATMTHREQVVGRHIFDVFPDNPADPLASGVSNLRSSLDRVCLERIPDAMAVQKYDIRRPAEEGSGFEERYWSPVNTPVCAQNGELLCIIHKVEDVTAFMRLRHEGAANSKRVAELQTRTARMELEIVARAQELQQANIRIRQLNEGLEQRVAERTAELRRTEAQLRQAQKMEAVGRLTGGIAHDFNNMLAVVLSYADLVLEQPHLGQDTRHLVEQIALAGQRAATLTHKLLTFSRQDVAQPRLLQVNALLQDMSHFLRRLVGEQWSIRLRQDSGPVTVLMDPSHLEQVVTNLVVNARDAMATGGTIDIQTAEVSLEAGYLHDGVSVMPGPYLMLAVSDSGVGMDDATQARIFEPFFTTKPVGRGTGLGLATVHGIVRQARGHIWVYSELGHGTVFKIYIPCANEAAEPLAPREAALVEPQGGTETILVVEDDQLVREATCTALRAKGYTVVPVPHATAAMEELRSDRPVDLLLTDVILPGARGPDLVRWALDLPSRRSLRVLYMSGYTDHSLGGAMLESSTELIQKPFTSRSLARKIREVLEAQTPR